MESIEPLPFSVRSSVRSGYIISDLIRVVEELVYNSLDAGANKVSVSVGPSTGYVKVEDDGSGISRDGLALLGERHVTSKQLHGAGCDAGTRSFGFRGESLCSISDVALIELRTRICGRPNGYHKIIKGRKCLYLGIDDERQSIGTTVTVQDIFYNQPVRRRQIQTSPKKTLDAVKKFLFQIALVRPEISYTLVDFESEIELFRTHASSTPVSIMSCHLGIEASSLQKLSVTDGKFKLTGYVGSPCDSVSMKALQYVYINSRLIVKGPIHKLLNSLASTCPVEVIGNKAGRSNNRSQAFPTYFLNLTCPLSLYNLNFDAYRATAEFKGLVDFWQCNMCAACSGCSLLQLVIVGNSCASHAAPMDWNPVLTLIKNSVSPLWITAASNDKPFGSVDDLTSKHGAWEEARDMALYEIGSLEEPKVPKKRRKLQKDGLLEVSFSPAMVVDDLREPKCSISPFRSSITSLFTNMESINDLEMEEDFDYSLNSSRSRNAFDCNFDIKDVSAHHSWRTNDELISYYKELSGDPSSSRRWDSCEEDIFIRKWMGKVDRTGEALNYFIPSECEGNPEDRGDDMKPFLRNCSSHTRADKVFSQDCLSPDNMFETLPSDLKRHRSRHLDGASNKHLYSGCKSGVIEVDALEKTGILSQGMMSQDEPSINLFYRGTNVESDDSEDLDHMLRVSQDFSYIHQDFAAREHDKYCLNAEDRVLDASFLSFPEPHYETTDSVFNSKPLGIEKFYRDMAERNLESEECINLENFRNATKVPTSQDSDVQLGHEILSPSFSGFNFRKSSLWPRTDTCGSFASEELFHDISSSFITEEKGFISSDLGNDSSPRSAIERSRSASAGSQLKVDLLNNPQVSSKRHYTESRVRSKSAPPIYRGKKKFLSVNSHMTYVSGCVKANASSMSRISCKFKDSDNAETVKFASECSRLPDINFVEGISMSIRQKMKGGVNSELETADMLNEKKPDALFDTSLELKWRNGYPKSGCDELRKNEMVREKSLSHQHESNVLDIDSEMLQLGSDILVPRSISRNCLKNTKVLLQVDKKFIPIVARSTLVIIDQHAADERIRLENLRQKVLAGEMKTIAYLEAEKELILPETSYQLLYNYAEQIRSWGWICNTTLHPQPFTKDLNLLNRQPTSVSLVAVPCILGVNLSDADLLEYIEQLADTDGSSAIPPSVLRLLNSKSCRGAIMFGDKLLPSECALIVEELKQTSLCFQCAHGRPTMVPLVDLKSLHKQIEKLQSWNGSCGESWHGLRRHSISLDRAFARLCPGEER